MRRFFHISWTSLEFLADAVEDTGEGVYTDLPYFAVAEAIFALLYSHKKSGHHPGLGLEPRSCG